MVRPSVARLMAACARKLSYPTRHEAEAAAVAAEIATKAMRRVDQALRVYACPFCGQYHLTKRNARKERGATNHRRSRLPRAEEVP